MKTYKTNADRQFRQSDLYLIAEVRYNVNEKEHQDGLYGQYIYLKFNEEDKTFCYTETDLRFRHDYHAWMGIHHYEDRNLSSEIDYPTIYNLLNTSNVRAVFENEDFIRSESLFEKNGKIHYNSEKLNEDLEYYKEQILINEERIEKIDIFKNMLIDIQVGLPQDATFHRYVEMYDEYLTGYLYAYDYTDKINDLFKKVVKEGGHEELEKILFQLEKENKERNKKRLECFGLYTPERAKMIDLYEELYRKHGLEYKKGYSGQHNDLAKSLVDDIENVPGKERDKYNPCVYGSILYAASRMAE